MRGELEPDQSRRQLGVIGECNSPKYMEAFRDRESTIRKYDYTRLEDKYDGYNDFDNDHDDLLNDKSWVDDYLEGNLSPQERSRAMDLSSRLDRYAERGEPYKDVPLAGDDTVEKEVNEFQSLLVEQTSKIPDYSVLSDLRASDLESLENSLRVEKEGSPKARLTRMERELDSIDRRLGEKAHTGDSEGRKDSLREARLLLRDEIAKTEIRIQQEADLGTWARLKNWVSERLDKASPALKRLWEVVKVIGSGVVGVLLLIRNFGAAVVGAAAGAVKQVLRLGKQLAPAAGRVLGFMGSGVMKGGELVAWLARNLWTLIIFPLGFGVVYLTR